MNHKRCSQFTVERVLRFGVRFRPKLDSGDRNNVEFMKFRCIMLFFVLETAKKFESNELKFDHIDLTEISQKKSSDVFGVIFILLFDL